MSEIKRAFIVLGLLCALPSCGAADCKDPKNAGNAACTVESAAVDCTGVSSLPTAIAVVEPIISKLIASARRPDGSVNWPAIEQQLIDLALQYGPCVVAEVWSGLLRNSPHTVGTPRLASDDLQKEFERIRARVAPGRAFVVGNGQKL